MGVFKAGVPVKYSNVSEIELVKHKTNFTKFKGKVDIQSISRSGVAEGNRFQQIVQKKFRNFIQAKRSSRRSGSLKTSPNYIQGEKSQSEEVSTQSDPPKEKKSGSLKTSPNYIQQKIDSVKEGVVVSGGVAKQYSDVLAPIERNMLSSVSRENAQNQNNDAKSLSLLALNDNAAVPEDQVMVIDTSDTANSQNKRKPDAITLIIHYPSEHKTETGLAGVLLFSICMCCLYFCCKKWCCGGRGKK